MEGQGNGWCDCLSRVRGNSWRLPFPAQPLPFCPGLPVSPAWPEELVLHPGIDFEDQVPQPAPHPPQVGRHVGQPRHHPGGRGGHSSATRPSPSEQRPQAHRPHGSRAEPGGLQRGARAKGKGRGCWLHRRAGWTHRHLQRPEGAGTDPRWTLNFVEAAGPFGSSAPQGTSGKPRGGKGGALGSGWLGMQPAPLFISCVTWVGQGTSLGLSFSQPSEDHYLTSSVFLSLPLSPPQTSPCPPSSTPLHPLPSRQPATF